MNYREGLEYGNRILAGAGISEHETDVKLLLSHVTGKDLTFFLAEGEEELDPEDEKSFRELIEKRRSRIPLQLITGETDFMGLNFFTSPGVLIPRIDTEFLVEEALMDINDGADVLDMCTGSGCILLSLMRYKNDIRGVGADISDEALALAKRNAENLGLTPELVKSDMFSGITGKFDHILCNPPYIRTGDIEGLMEEVRLHEPENALDGGEDGLSFYRRIALEAGEHLFDGGSLILEIGAGQGSEVREILENKGFGHIEVLKDYSGNERVVKCLKSLKKQS